jgi:hypothetical protein
MVAFSLAKGQLQFEMSPPPAEKKVFEKPLLPGCGRPMNYKPKDHDLDYIRNLFPNALSKLDITMGLVGYVAHATAIVRTPGY